MLFERWLGSDYVATILPPFGILMCFYGTLCSYDTVGAVVYLLAMCSNKLH